jgi:hypothetical protein
LREAPGLILGESSQIFWWQDLRKKQVSIAQNTIYIDACTSQLTTDTVYMLIHHYTHLLIYGAVIDDIS